MKSAVPSTVDEYFASIDSDSHRAALVAMRKVILDEVPEAKEVVSYGMPTYKFNKTSVSIGSFKDHCSFFPGYTVQEFTDELKGFKTSTGTVQFTPERPIPEALIRAILRARFRPERK